MDLNRLVTHFAYKIEPKPEGGFIARATDPSVPPLEAPTRQELQQKIQQNILAVLSTEFPGLKIPTDGKKVEMSLDIEHTPGRGFSIHSSDTNAAVIETGDPKEFESRFLEKFQGLTGRQLAPEMLKVLAAKASSRNVKVVINGKTLVQVNSALQGSTPEDSSPVLSASPGMPQIIDGNAGLPQFGGTIGNNPITQSRATQEKSLASSSRCLSSRD